MGSTTGLKSSIFPTRWTKIKLIVPLSHHDRLYHGVTNFFFVLKSGMPLRNERVIAVKQCVGKIGANSLILSL